jgi:glycogen phosphorylase
MYSIKESLRATLPERIAGLADLALNLWWSWHIEARLLFKMLSRVAWKISVHNPVEMLNNLDQETLEGAAQDPKFLRHYDAVMAGFRNDLEEAGGWFYTHVADPGMLPIAFFCAEYGLHHSLPFYAGGLGFLSGDFLKESSDLGAPVVAVGFMYPEGYLRQRMTPDGQQSSESERTERENAPTCRVLNEAGERLVVRIPVIRPPISVELWRVQIGRIPLFLMDTDIEANDPWNRHISDRLYIGDHELRLRQEIVLGIGGTEVLNALGIEHSALHLNEGHPAFAILERIRERVEGGMSFEEAAEQVRATTIFTTHTPVPAGHDVFPFALMEKYFSSYWPTLGLERDAFFRLGLNPGDPQAGFNMTTFALRMSGYRNAVSKRHGEVTRKMWHCIWPDLDEAKVPIGHITDGIHIPTWIEPRMMQLFNEHLPTDWLSNPDNPDIWGLVDDIPDEKVWRVHYWLKVKLVLRIMDRARERLLRDTANPQVILASGVLLDPNALTIGFARRFASYKRAGLILRDRERLKRILNDPWRPVQIIFAGKAHPDDDAGKQVLKEVFDAAKDPFFGGRIAFVEDYGEQLAQYLLHGVDVWLNTPLPPMEACGTSGMKAMLNGVPQLSVLDGWWVEGFNGRNGWAFGAEGGEKRDEEDAEALYHLLEQAVIPLYYKAGNDDIPHDWVKLMKEAIKSAAPFFNSRRVVKEYAGSYAKALKAAQPTAGKDR